MGTGWRQGNPPPKKKNRQHSESDSKNKMGEEIEGEYYRQETRNYQRNVNRKEKAK